MTSKKVSPKREINYEPSMKVGKYGSMTLFYIIVIAAVTSCVFFLVYSGKSHGASNTDDNPYIDSYEHDYGRMTISAYASIISLLVAILILLFYMTYLVHTHLKH